MKSEKLLYNSIKSAKSSGFTIGEHLTLTGLLRSYAVLRQAKTPTLDPKTPIFPTPFESLQKSSNKEEGPAK
jgi:hypothetical protein